MFRYTYRSLNSELNRVEQWPGKGKTWPSKFAWTMTKQRPKMESSCKVFWLNLDIYLLSSSNLGRYGKRAFCSKIIKAVTRRSFSKKLWKLSQNSLQNHCTILFLKKFRSNYWRYSVKKMFLKTSQILQKSTCENYEIFKNTYFEEHLQKTVSENCRLYELLLR